MRVMVVCTYIANNVSVQIMMVRTRLVFILCRKTANLSLFSKFLEVKNGSTFTQAIMKILPLFKVTKVNNSLRLRICKEF